jgi:hypothetical protein
LAELSLVGLKRHQTVNVPATAKVQGACRRFFTLVEVLALTEFRQVITSKHQFYEWNKAGNERYFVQNVKSDALPFAGLHFAPSLIEVPRRLVPQPLFGVSNQLC